MWILDLLYPFLMFIWETRKDSRRQFVPEWMTGRVKVITSYGDKQAETTFKITDSKLPTQIQKMDV